jgi:competence protein ComEC
MKERFHTSWQIAAVSWGIICGLGLALLHISFSPLVLALGIIISLACLFFRYAFLVPIALIGGAVIGTSLGSIHASDLSKYQPFYGQNIYVSGIVSEDVSTNKNGEQRIKLSNVKIGDTSLVGEVWLSAKSSQTILRGDFIVAQGKLEVGFGGFAATMFKAKLIKVEQPKPGDLARNVRDWFAEAVRKAIPSPQVDLGLGYLLGQRNDLPEELNEQLKTLGLTHVVVASGYNLTILVKFARRGFSKISKWLSALSAGLMISGFVLMTGFSPSMTRAGIVTFLCLIAWYYGRNIHPLVLLPFVAAVTLVISPSSLWGDIGWYLSFSAFAGVIILAPLVNKYFWGSKKPGFLREILIGTVCAQIATFPVLAYFFGQFSPFALPANLAILPFVPPAMVLVFLSGLGSLLFPGGAQLFGMPAHWLLSYMTTVVDWGAKLPTAKSEINFGVSALIISYLAILIVIVFIWRKTKFNFYQQNIIE